MWKPKHKNGMKRLAILMCCIALGFAAKAQRVEGALGVLNNERVVHFEISFASASIHGMTETEFAQYEGDWYKDMPSIVEHFVENLNEHMHNRVHFGNYPTANYKLRVEVINVSVKGDFDSDVFLIDREGNTVAKMIRLIARGGRIGTKLNLIKDGAEHSGELLGDILFETLRNIKNDSSNVKEKR